MFEFYTFDIERFVSRMSICIRIGIGDFPLNCYKLAQRQRATCPGGADDGEFVVAGVLWGYGYCLRQYAFARALSPVGNTRTFARYRLRRYARIVGLRGLWKRCRAKKFLVDFGKAISEKNSGERLADDGNGCA